MECPLIVLLVGSAVLSAGCGTSGRRFERAGAAFVRVHHTSSSFRARWPMSPGQPGSDGFLTQRRGVAANCGPPPADNSSKCSWAARPSSKGPQIAKTSRRDA